MCIRDRVYYDLTHLYGSPRARKSGTDFYWNMVQMYGLSPRVTLEGFSRGGLFAYNWAADHPDKVACIYVDAPVCDVFSWPGRSSGNAGLWKGCLLYTSSGEPAKRNAHDATLSSGRRCFSRPTMCSGTFDNRPPRCV